MVAGPGTVDPYEQLAARIASLESALQEQGRRAIPDTEIPMYPRFVPTFPIPHDGDQYWETIPSDAGHIVEKTYWEGRIGDVWHPKLYIDGTWGYRVGSGTATYRVYINLDLVGFFVQSSWASVYIGPMDISAYLHQKNVALRLTLQMSAVNTNARVAVAALGAFQRRE